MSRPTFGRHEVGQGVRQTYTYTATPTSTIRETLTAARAAVASNEAGRHGLSSGRIPVAVSRRQSSDPASAIATAPQPQRLPITDLPPSTSHLRPITDMCSTPQVPSGLNAIRNGDRIQHIRRKPLFTVPDSTLGDEDSTQSSSSVLMGNDSEVNPALPQRLSQVSLVKPSRPITARIHRSLATEAPTRHSSMLIPNRGTFALPSSEQNTFQANDIDHAPTEKEVQKSPPLRSTSKELVESLKKLFENVSTMPVPRPPSAVGKGLVPRPPSVRQGRPASTPNPLGEDIMLPAPLPRVRETPKSTLILSLPLVQSLFLRITNPTFGANPNVDENDTLTDRDKVWISALSLVVLGDLAYLLVSEASEISKEPEFKVEVLHKPLRLITFLHQDDKRCSMDESSSDTVFSLAHSAFQQLLKVSLDGNYDSMLSTCVPAIAHFLVSSLIVAAGVNRTHSAGVSSKDKFESKESELGEPLPKRWVDAHTTLLIDALQLLHNLTSSVIPRNRQSTAAPSIVAVLAALLEPTLWISDQCPVMDRAGVLFSQLKSSTSVSEAIRLKPFAFSSCTPSLRDEAVSKVLSLLRNLSRLRRSSTRPASGSSLKPLTNNFDSDATLISFEGQGILGRLMSWLLLSCIRPKLFSSDIRFHCSRVLGRLSEIPSYIPRLGADPLLILSMLALLNDTTERIDTGKIESISQELQTLIRLLYVCGNVTTTVQGYKCDGLALDGYGDVLNTEGKDQTHSWLIVTAKLSCTERKEQQEISGICVLVNGIDVFTKQLARLDPSEISALGSSAESGEGRTPEGNFVTLLAATTTKMIRLIANCALDPQVGLHLALIGRSGCAEANKDTQEGTERSFLELDESRSNMPDSFSRALQFCASCGIEALPELTLNVVACITNISFYSSKANLSETSDNLGTTSEVAIPVYFQKYHPVHTLPSLLSILMLCANSVLSNEHDHPPTFYLELAVETARALGNASREKIHKAYLAISRVDEALLLLIQSERLISAAPQILQAAGGVLINLTTNMYPSLAKSDDLSDFDLAAVDSLLQLISSSTSGISSEERCKDLSVDGGFVRMVSFRQDCFLIESSIQLIERCEREFLSIIQKWEAMELPSPIDVSFAHSIEAADLMCKVLFNLGCCILKSDSNSDTVLKLSADKLHSRHCNEVSVADRLRTLSNSLLRGVNGIYGDKLTMIIDRRRDASVTDPTNWSEEDVELCVQCEGALIALSTLLTQVWVSLSSQDSGSQLLPFEIHISSDQELLTMNNLLVDEGKSNHDLEVLDATAQELGSFVIAPDYYVEIADDDEFD